MGHLRYYFQENVSKQWFPGGSDGKESACNGGDPASSSWSGKSPGEGQPTPVFLPGEFHGQQPGGLQSMGLQELDTTATSQLTMLC